MVYRVVSKKAMILNECFFQWVERIKNNLEKVLKANKKLYKINN